MSRVIGYILSIAGLVVLASGIKGFEIIFKFIPFLSNISKTYSIIGGLVLVLVGIVILRGSGGGRQAAEVPIYKGKNIVGYRRHR